MPLLTEKRLHTLGRLIRFGLVGVANTAVYYGFYRLFLLVLPYVAAHLVAWVLSVVFSFFANCFFTYRVRPTWRRFVEFPASTLANLLLTTFGSILLVQWVGVDQRYATLIMGILAIPVTFTITTFILTRPRSTDAASVEPSDRIPTVGQSGLEA